MPSPPPSFGSQEYWDKRFTSNSNPFDWLESPTALDPYLVAALAATKEAKHDSRQQILHIGCGTSLLSYHLRAHVQDPETIHNVDYSKVAIELGQKREVDIYNNVQVNIDNNTICGDTEPPSTPKYMRWFAANLLDPNSLVESFQPGAYSVIVDKSTSDSIACSDDISVQLPYPVGTVSGEIQPGRPFHFPEPIHPLHVLAVHLAWLVKPMARWVSLSYSEDRFPFLNHSELSPDTNDDPSIEPPKGSSGDEEVNSVDDDLDHDLDDIPQELIANGFPDPSTLWKLEARYAIEVPEPAAPHESQPVHKPKILHWVYVLRRTEVEVVIRER
jgi:hypothetical protein